MTSRSRTFDAPQGRDDLERDLDDELRFHLEMEAAQLATRGHSPDEAATLARRRFGSLEAVKEDCREERPGYGFELFGRDLRFGLRTLSRRPSFTVAAVLTLALGIGANAAVFSVVRGVLLRPLPYGAGDRLVTLRQADPVAAVADAGFAVQEFYDLRKGTKTLDGLVEYHHMWFNLLGRGEPMRVRTGVVSHEYFSLLGVAPLLGRSFLAQDEAPGAPPVLVLSHSFWKNAFGGDPQVVGEVFQMNDQPHAVIGVLPPLPPYPDANDVFMPTAACPFRSAQAMEESRTMRGLSLLGRLAPGSSIAAAQAELGELVRGMAEEHPEAYEQGKATEMHLHPMREVLTSEARPSLVLLFGTVVLVLVLACANVASLTLARLQGRERELALRRVLGAGKGRLWRQLATESSLLAIAGGVVGLLLALPVVELLSRWASGITPRAEEIRLDGQVLLFTLAVALATGLALGALAVVRSTGVDPGQSLKAGARQTGSGGRIDLRRALVIGQLAVSAVLLTGAGLMVRTLVNLYRVDPGFETTNVVKARLDLNWSRYQNGPQMATFWNSLLDEVTGLPGVAMAAVASTVPLGEPLASARLELRGETPPEGTAPRIGLRLVSPHYFAALGMDFVEGGTFSPADDAEAPRKAILSRSLAARHWPASSPLGQELTLDGGDTWWRVVGVVDDVKQDGLAAEISEELYLALSQSPPLSGNLLVRVDDGAELSAQALRRAVARLDPEQPIVDVGSLEELRRDAMAAPRLISTLLALFAGLALAITTTGLAGLLAFQVSQRVPEIGVRLALGATPGLVRKLILRQGLALVGLGLGAGVLGALFLGRSLSTLLYGVEPGDPWTLAAVIVVLFATAGFACWLPARRAANVDPMAALRSD